MGNFFALLGGRGGTQECQSQILVTISFLSGEIAGKTSLVRKNFIGNINIHLSQTKSFKFGQVRHRQQDS